MRNIASIESVVNDMINHLVDGHYYDSRERLEAMTLAELFEIFCVLNSASSTETVADFFED